MAMAEARTKLKELKSDIFDPDFFLYQYLEIHTAQAKMSFMCQL